MEFTHFNQDGNAIMVDVSGKNVTSREAAASGRIFMTEECYGKIKRNEMGKGDVLGVARVAGIMATKRTSDLIPLCHVIAITKAEIDFAMSDEDYSVTVMCKVKCNGQTGVEMEALMGASVALLTIYDMCKAVDKKMHIEEVHLCSKSGGKSGDFCYDR